MPTSVSKTVLFTGNAPIKFSDLSSTFRDGKKQNIKFSDYKRDTNRDTTSPVIPDATENEGISAADTDLRVSGFRNCVTSYDVVQTGTDATLDLGSSTLWNGNLNRNIIKKASIEGICHATATSNYGVKLEAETYNLDIDISGQIYGEGGTPGAPKSSTIVPGTVNTTTNTTVYNIIPVTRYFNASTGDHYSTTSQGTAAPSGYVSEGTLCQVYSTQAPGTTAIYNADGAGRPNSGIMGYAYIGSAPSVSYVTIYALTNGSDTMWSTATSEGAYTLLRTEFYAPTQAFTQTTTTTSTTPGSKVVVPPPPSTTSDGGGALYVRNATTRTSASTKIDISLNSTARVWAGGGAGRSGNDGFAGPAISCSATNNFTTSNPFTGGRSLADAKPGRSCRRSRSGATWYAANPNSTRTRCRGGSPRRGESGYQCSPHWTVYCKQTNYYTVQGNAGFGGSGGVGRGWSTFNSSIDGNPGNPGNSSSCGGSSSTGNRGNPGSIGGEWGEDSSGKKGPAIVGNPTYYRLRGDSTTNFKGSIRNI